MAVKQSGFAGDLMRKSNVLMASAALFVAICGTGEAIAQCGPGSVGFASVGLVARNPFQADLVTTMTLGEGESTKTFERYGSVSRDSAGRIRSERVTAKFKVKTGDDTGKEVESKTILICDPVAQTITQLDPLGKTAKVWRWSHDGKTNPGTHPQNYCAALFVFTDLEDLGHRAIEGLDAQGKRRVDEREKRVDGDGRDLPPKSDDQWCAPELQAIVLQISQDVEIEVMELKNIRRVEPDSSLFQIPQDYTILEKTTWPSPKSSAHPPIEP